MKGKKLVVVVCSVLVALMLVGCSANTAQTSGSAGDTSADTGESASAGSDTSAAAGGEKWKIALSNNFIGNDWRQNMEAIAEMVAADPYYADRVTLDIIDCDNTPEAQTASIDALAEQGYDAIVVDASSTTGIDNALKRAEEKDIVIVVFDQVVDTDEFVKMECDWEYVGETSAKFIAEACNYEGNYVMDRGLSGSATAKVLYDSATAWLDANTDMVLVAEFESEYAEGPAEQGVTAAMTANPQIDAVFSQGYVGCIARAFRNAGREIPVITGGGSNGTALDATEYNDYVCLQWDCNLAGMGAMAMEQAIQILEGNMPEEKHIIMQDAVWKSTNPEYGDAIGITIQAYVENENYFTDYPAGFSWPVLPADFPVQIDVADLVERQQSFS